MKLWEVIKALEENSKKVFEVEGSPSHRIGFSDEGTLSWLNPYGEDNCDFSIATYDNNKYGSDNIHTDWQEVKKFIQKMLSPEIEGRQINLFELLMEEAR